MVIKEDSTDDDDENDCFVENIFCSVVVDGFKGVVFPSVVYIGDDSNSVFVETSELSGI